MLSTKSSGHGGLTLKTESKDPVAICAMRLITALILPTRKRRYPPIEGLQALVENQAARLSAVAWA